MHAGIIGMLRHPESRRSPGWEFPESGEFPAPDHSVGRGSLPI
jgi:hypothetical protein